MMLPPAVRVRRKQILTLAVGVVGIFAVILLGLYIGDASQAKPAPQTAENRLMRDYTLKPSQAASAEQVWISRSEQQLASLEQQNRRLQEQLNQLQQNVKNINMYPRIDKVSPIPPPPRFEGVTTASDKDNGNNTRRPRPPQPAQRRPSNPFAGTKQATRVASRGVTTDTATQEAPEETIEHIVIKKPTAGKKKTKTMRIQHYLPPGSFATAVLLSGLDAPTGGLGQSNPMPVLMRVVKPGTLPNLVRSDLKHCHVVGAAYGDISSERAMIRLENLACVLQNDEVIEAKVKGYVAGEDGKSGFRGRVVSKQGAMIARALVAGLASGVSSAISQQYRTVSQTALGSVSSVDPQRIAELGMATGASNALEKIADYYIARANETYPVIEIASNRVGEIILTAGADLETEFVGQTRQEEK